MTLWQEYLQPTSLSEAIQDLKSAPDPVLLVAGGTDVLLELKQGHLSPVHTLIDLSNIPELCAVEERGDTFFIGAAVPINRLMSHPGVIKHAQALVDACHMMAGPQVRNTATLGGNVAHALPAADGTITLLALDAQVQIASSAGLRMIPFSELFLGPGKSSLDKKTEIITGFFLPLNKPGQASCFKRIMRPQGVALPILNCAVWIHREDDSIHDVRIAVGPGGPKPFRATNAEKFLTGKQKQGENLAEAVRELIAQAQFRTSPLRATADYRKHVVSGVFSETFEEAWKRAA